MANGCFACKHLFAFDALGAYCDYPDELSLTEDGDIIICNNFEPKEENNEGSKSADTK